MAKNFIDPNGVEWILTAGGHWLNTSKPKEVITEYELWTRYPMFRKLTKAREDSYKEGMRDEHC